MPLARTFLTRYDFLWDYNERRENGSVCTNQLCIFGNKATEPVNSIQFDSFWKVFVTETCLPGSASVGSRYYKSVAVA